MHTCEVGHMSLPWPHLSVGVEIFTMMEWFLMPWSAGKAREKRYLGVSIHAKVHTSLFSGKASDDGRHARSRDGKKYGMMVKPLIFVSLLSLKSHSVLLLPFITCITLDWSCRKGRKGRGKKQLRRRRGNLRQEKTGRRKTQRPQLWVGCWFIWMLLVGNHDKKFILRLLNNSKRHGPTSWQIWMTRSINRSDSI